MTVEECTAWLSTAEVAARAGLSCRQLDYWCRNGVIVPAGVADWHDGPAESRWPATPGTGRARRFSERQVAVLEACGRLARLCADTPALAALVAACEDVELPATVVIDADGHAHAFEGTEPSLGSVDACWVVRVRAPG